MLRIEYIRHGIKSKRDYSVTLVRDVRVTWVVGKRHVTRYNKHLFEPHVTRTCVTLFLIWKSGEPRERESARGERLFVRCVIHAPLLNWQLRLAVHAFMFDV